MLKFHMRKLAIRHLQAANLGSLPPSLRDLRLGIWGYWVIVWYRLLMYVRPNPIMLHSL